MTVFDLLFLALVLTAVGTLVAAATAAVRGRRPRAASLLRRLALSAAAYLALVAAVSLATPQRFLGLGDPQCSDDWCIAVTAVQREPAAAGIAYHVTFRVSSRARRARQRERNVLVTLRDATGRSVDAAPAPGAVPFDVELGPGEEATTTRTFFVPRDAHVAGVVVSRGGIPFPGFCIIGDESSLFHKKTIVRLN